MPKYIISLEFREPPAPAAFYLTSRAIFAVQRRRSLRRSYPQPGWVEHDPMEIWSTQLSVTMEAMESWGRIIAILRP